MGSQFWKTLEVSNIHTCLVSKGGNVAYRLEEILDGDIIQHRFGQPASGSKYIAGRDWTAKHGHDHPTKNQLLHAVTIYALLCHGNSNIRKQSFPFPTLTDPVVLLQL